MTKKEYMIFYYNYPFTQKNLLAFYIVFWMIMIKIRKLYMHLSMLWAQNQRKKKLKEDKLWENQLQLQLLLI